VLISPAVPSAPTLLPVTPLFVLSFMVMAFLVIVRRGQPIVRWGSHTLAASPGAAPDLAAASHPLRR
jgi:hypothetical protein